MNMAGRGFLHVLAIEVFSEFASPGEPIMSGTQFGSV